MLTLIVGGRKCEVIIIIIKIIIRCKISSGDNNVGYITFTTGMYSIGKGHDINTLYLVRRSAQLKEGNR